MILSRDGNGAVRYGKCAGFTAGVPFTGVFPNLSLPRPISGGFGRLSCCDKIREMRLIRLSLCCLALCCVVAMSGQQAASPPLVRSWTIRETGAFRKIPTATLREKMAQRGVLFGVNEPYDQNKVDGTTLLLKQLYKDAGVIVVVVPSRVQVGPNAVKVEYMVRKQ